MLRRTSSMRPYIEAREQKQRCCVVTRGAAHTKGRQLKSSSTQRLRHSMEASPCPSFTASSYGSNPSDEMERPLRTPQYFSEASGPYCSPTPRTADGEHLRVARNLQRGQYLRFPTNNQHLKKINLI